MAHQLTLDFQLSGKPARVMQLLTDSVLIRKWSGEDGFIGANVGDDCSWLGGWASGKVLNKTDKVLTCTWLSEDWPEGTEHATVSFELKEQYGGTLVTLKHTNLPTEEEVRSYKSGWSDFFFDPLEDYILIVDKS